MGGRRDGGGVRAEGVEPVAAIALPRFVCPTRNTRNRVPEVFLLHTRRLYHARVRFQPSFITVRRPDRKFV